MSHRGKQQGGFALISVLVALAILLALLVPFLSSILNEGQVSSGVVATEKTQVEVRGLVAHLLHQAGQGHPSHEISGEGGSPDWDALSEYPQRMSYPQEFESKPRRVLRSGAIEDLQRKIHLPTASPLVLGNLLGLATTLAGSVEKDAEEISVIDGSRFPEDGGALFVFGERINYQRRAGNTFVGISRTTSYPRNLPDETLVLDYRVVLAVTCQFQRAGRKQFVPYSNVREVQAIGELAGSPGRFSKTEMDTLLAHCTTYGQNDYSDTWGRKIRIFNDRNTRQAGPVWFLRTKTALGFGGGSIVRITSLDDPDQVEYNFVWGTSRPTSGTGSVRLQSRWRLNLAFNPTFRQDHIKAVVEPLVPVAVNINTAGREVLSALFEKMRKGRVPTRERDRGQVYGAPISQALADEMVARVMTLRGGSDQEGDEGRPFQGFEDLSKRFLHYFADKFKESGDGRLKTALVVLTENLLYGRGPLAEMATMPICFSSSSLVKFRAAALRMRPSGLEVARSEVEGVASVMPEHGLDFLSYRQRDWLENIRLNRRSPNYITFPKALGVIDPGVLGTDPGVVYPGLLYAELYPDVGLGNLRFPSQDLGSIRMGTAITRPAVRRRERGIQWNHESFRFAEHPDGRDIATEGVFDMINTGPRSRGGGRRKPRHPDASFPFTSDNEGMPGRHAVTFWFKLEGLGDQCVYDFASEHFDRNRINLRFEGENLVFEVLDEAGLDPNPSDTQTQPDRTAAVWRVPTQQMNLQADVWYHVNLSADGNRADQLALFIDGVPREEPEFQTRLTGEIAEYARPTGDQPISQTDAEKYPQITVESTEGFPPQGVLRIGRELFEYTSKDDSGFSCRPMDSMGGRKARMSWAEYRENLDQHLDEYGRPTINAEDLEGSETEDKAPAIPSGATVELYGYAASLYRDKAVAVGSTRLRDQMGAWSLARVFVENPKEIRLPGSQVPFSPGRGLDPTETPDLYLVNPVADEEGKGPPDKSDGDEPILAGFPDGGGYALLVQQHRTWGAQLQGQLGQQPLDIRTGGMELIQYTKRDGNKLSGITRNVKLDGAEKLLNEGDQLYGGASEGRYFVSEWGRFVRANVSGEIIPFSELQQMVLYVVPISLPVNDVSCLNDPAETQTVEWAQIYPGKGNEQDTEWVRYNLITKEGELVRAHHNAWRSLYNTICHRIGDRTLLATGGGIGRGNEPTVTPLAFKPPQDDGQKRIGYIDQLEQDHGIVYYARRALSFRGDPTTGTTSHAFSGGAEVMAGHRLELDWGKLGALSARCGRNDRVALVGGTKASGDARPPLEWHTLNWKWQRHGGDNYNREPSDNGVEPEHWGPWSFQMVAFKAPVQNVFVGPEQRTDLLDTRRVDRVVKFPSGELPAAYVEAAHFGGVNPSVGDYSSATGMIDEVSALHKYTETTVLNVEVTAEATEIPIRLHTRLFSYGTIGVRNQMTQSYPQEGGLLRIDNELIAYKSHADGVFQVAENGRGLLGTEAREHGDCARVHFVPQIPCAILAGGAGASTNMFTTQDNGSFPHYAGTFLMGQELVHYTWTSEDNKILEMPRWFDPDDDQTDGMGLLRGRYGTVPQAGASGSPILWFPTRFWDRYHERSEDPEVAYYQVTRRETPVFFTGIRWKEENPASSFLKLHAVVNIDKAGSFAADPDKVRGMFEFHKGTVDDKSNKLNWQGSLIEVRFATEYKPGAFDPESYMSNGWKRAITVKDLIINYQGRSQILEEYPTSR